MCGIAALLFLMSAFPVAIPFVFVPCAIISPLDFCVDAALTAVVVTSRPLDMRGGSDIERGAIFLCPFSSSTRARGSSILGTNHELWLMMRRDNEISLHAR